MSPMELYEKLHNRYGELHWWPAETPYEVMVGAVLTQNTAWRNVEKAIENLKAAAGGMLTPDFIAAMAPDALSVLIRPAGFFNQKAAYIKTLTAWYARYGYSVETVRRHDKDALRKELLAVRGIGRETADAVLLYAFGLASFVVDAYTFRLLERLEPGAAAKRDYEKVKSFFERTLPRDVYLYNNFHACIVVNAKEYCRAKPLCKGCPLKEDCGAFSPTGVIPPSRVSP